MSAFIREKMRYVYEFIKKFFRDNEQSVNNLASLSMRITTQ